MNESLKSCLGGGAGGMAAVFSGHPLDTMKVKIQCFPEHLSMGKCFKLILKESGPKGFYRGMSTPLLLATPVSALAFMGNTWAKATILPTSDTLLKTTLCGFIAGSISTLVACPGEQIKCIIQNDPKFKTPFSAAKHIIKNNGIQGLYRGMIFTNMRDAPAYAVYFLTYRLFRQGFDGHLPESVAAFMSGGLAGTLLWVVAMPGDNLKSRIQTDTIGKYKSLNHCVVDLYTHAGLGGFYRGFTPTMLRAFPTNAICFLFYELTMDFLSKNQR